MPSAIQREICYHPNANVYQVVGAITRHTITAVPGGPTVAQQIARLITEGAIDRRPGSPNQLIGNDAVYYLEPLVNI